MVTFPRYENLKLMMCNRKRRKWLLRSNLALPDSLLIHFYFILPSCLSDKFNHIIQNLPCSAYPFYLHYYNCKYGFLDSFILNLQQGNLYCNFQVILPVKGQQKSESDPEQIGPKQPSSWPNVKEAPKANKKYVEMFILVVSTSVYNLMPRNCW